MLPKLGVGGWIPRPQEAEDGLENHHARDVEHRDERDRRQDVRRGEQQQNAPVALPRGRASPRTYSLPRSVTAALRATRA